MTTRTYLVASLVRYELVDARDEAEARQLGEAALTAAAGRPQAPYTVRLATEDEIELIKWHNEMVANEARNS